MISYQTLKDSVLCKKVGEVSLKHKAKQVAIMRW
jgi:hypothetical protein